jgi:hypothetical protein
MGHYWDSLVTIGEKKRLLQLANCDPKPGQNLDGELLAIERDRLQAPAASKRSDCSKCVVGQTHRAYIAVTLWSLATARVVSFGIVAAVIAH